MATLKMAMQQLWVGELKVVLKIVVGVSSARELFTIDIKELGSSMQQLWVGELKVVLKIAVGVSSARELFIIDIKEWRVLCSSCGCES